MTTIYTATPHNFNEIELYVTTDLESVTLEIYRKDTCYFYDACSFRRHANLAENELTYLFQYFKMKNGIVVLMRCILMELASHSGVLNPEYIRYIRAMKDFGINILLIYEEDLFHVMDCCFGTTAMINSYLIWTVRMIKGPVSTITETLNEDRTLQREVLEGKNMENRGMYKAFFQAVRNHKESGDNLSEELLAICLHILSHLGERDGKFCLITDDKGAAGKIDVLFQNTTRQYRGSKIMIFSTPKLVQFLYEEGILDDKAHMRSILNTGNEGNLVLLGTREYDLRTNEIRIGCDELVELIYTPNAIHITF